MISLGFGAERDPTAECSHLGAGKVRQLLIAYYAQRARTQTRAHPKRALKHPPHNTCAHAIYRRSRSVRPT
jgi:hypothetical protein